MLPPVPAPQPPTRVWPTILSTAVLVLTVVHGTLVWRVVNVVPPPRPAPVPAPVVPTPAPKPAPTPTPAPTPAPVVTAKLYVSLVFDPHVDSQAVAKITSDSTLASTLRRFNAEWYPIDTREAQAIGLDTKFGQAKPPLIVVQVEGDESHPLIFPLPSGSAGVVAIVKNIRGDH